jgi:hypothetical protein
MMMVMVSSMRLMKPMKPVSAMVASTTTVNGSGMR